MRPDRHASRAGAGERGFALVELLAAIAILTVGVLGTVTMIQGAGHTTRTTKAREGATSLSREIVDTVRAIPYAQLTDADVAAALAERAALADASPGPGYTIDRRGRVYTVSVTVCAVDDSKDGLGSHDVAVAFCPDSGATGTRDRNADDLRRVTVALEWAEGGDVERNRQTATITNPAGGLGPTVSEVALLPPPAVADPTSPTITDPAVGVLNFSVKLNTPAAAVTWAVNGDVQGDGTGSGTAWTVSWQLTPKWKDGSYSFQAQGYDAQGRAGSARKIGVVLNRTPPSAPSGFDGGRNKIASHVDLEWHASAEGDVVGYRVYRTNALGQVIERACPPASEPADAYLAATSCVDEAAPALGPIHYKAVAVDLAPGGGLREGAATAVKQIVEVNTAPVPPLNLIACAGGDPACLLPDGTTASPGTTVVTWAATLDVDLGDSVRFYRVYRDGTGYEHRYGRVYASAGLVPKFVDTAPGGGAHTYRVTAVDTRFGESGKSFGVTR